MIGIMASALAAGSVADTDTPPAKACLYVVRASTGIEVTLPLPEPPGRQLVRGSDGRWHPVKGAMGKGDIRLAFSVGDLSDGEVLVALGCPADIVLDDHEPPKVVGVVLDQTPCSPGATLDLGTLDAPPDHISVTFQDEANALLPASTRVTIAGDCRRPGESGVAWTPGDSPRTGTVEITPGAFPVEARSGEQSIEVCVDDVALDRVAGTCTIRYHWVPPYTLPDGRRLSVDSVTDAEGWQDWWVVADGVHMDASGKTTAGLTWLSQPHNRAHWIRMDFPEDKQIRGVRLWWPYYKQYRTSRSFRVQALGANGAWRTVAKVDDRTEEQMTEVHFSPVRTKAVRVWQPPLSGQRDRAEYMWLAEFEVE